jgi:hypothetical protein
MIRTGLLVTVLIWVIERLPALATQSIRLPATSATGLASAKRLPRKVAFQGLGCSVHDGDGVLCRIGNPKQSVTHREGVWIGEAIMLECPHLFIGAYIYKVEDISRTRHPKPASEKHQLLWPTYVIDGPDNCSVVRT